MSQTGGRPKNNEQNETSCCANHRSTLSQKVLRRQAGWQSASPYNGCACVMKILVINGGSSSLKCWVSDLPDGPLPTAAQQPKLSAHAAWSPHSRIPEIHIKPS